MCCCENCEYFDCTDCSCKAYLDYVDDPKRQWCEDYQEAIR